MYAQANSGDLEGIGTDLFQGLGGFKHIIKHQLLITINAPWERIKQKNLGINPKNCRPITPFKKPTKNPMDKKNPKNRGRNIHYDHHKPPGKEPGI